MTWAIVVVLLAGWSAGLVTGDSFGGGLHLLLLGAMVLLLLELLSQPSRTRGQSRR